MSRPAIARLVKHQFEEFQQNFLLCGFRIVQQRLPELNMSVHWAKTFADALGRNMQVPVFYAQNSSLNRVRRLPLSSVVRSYWESSAIEMMSSARQSA